MITTHILISYFCVTWRLLMLCADLMHTSFNEFLFNYTDVLFLVCFWCWPLYWLQILIVLALSVQCWVAVLLSVPGQALSTLNSSSALRSALILTLAMMWALNPGQININFVVCFNKKKILKFYRFSLLKSFRGDDFSLLSHMDFFFNLN